MADSPPTGAVIEIIERGATTDDTPGGSVIVPNEVRINGHALLCSAEHPVTVHQIDVYDHSMVTVTLTLLARRVVVAAEGDI